MLYAGATDAVAITVVDINPSAPDLRPLSSGCSAGAARPVTAIAPPLLKVSARRPCGTLRLSGNKDASQN
jgi:hypothetical protein